MKNKYVSQSVFVIFFLLIITVIFAACNLLGGDIEKHREKARGDNILPNGTELNSPVLALWARTISAGSFAFFMAVAADGNGNVYAAGRQDGAETYGYGNGVVTAGTGSKNPVLVRYDSSGTALWARTAITAGSDTDFRAIAADSADNVYAAGYQMGAETRDYGDGVIAAGTYNNNPVLVKYNSSGTALWARTKSIGSSAGFHAVAVDDAENVYAAGYQYETEAHDYGYGAAATGTGITNPVLVKYSSSGTALWARTISAGSYSSFQAVAVDSDGNVYAAGRLEGNETYNYGDGVTATGTSSYNPVLVKYSSSGTALWARTITAGFSASAWFSAVAVDSVGNVYIAGMQIGTVTYAYGDGVTAAGTGTYFNPVLVKYNSSGTALWARTITAGYDAYFEAVAVDSAGNVYASGTQDGTVTYAYGDGVTATGAGIRGNPVLVMYNPSGTALWARTVTAGFHAYFPAVAVDGNGDIFAAGSQDGTVNYGDGIIATGTGSNSPILVKYVNK